MQVHDQKHCLELHLPQLLGKTYFIIFDSLGQQSFRKEFYLVLFQRIKKNAGNFLTVAFVPVAKTYVFVISEICTVQAVKRIKLMVENSDEIDINPSPDYQDTMSSTSTTA